MHLSQVQFHHIRNLENGALQLAPHLTWISGLNGAGKTSLLEAIYLLSTGRSFRTNSTDRVISDKETQFIVFGEAYQGEEAHRIGLQRNRNGQLSIRLNGSDVKRLAEIAQLLPVLVFTPDSYHLVSGSPKERRRYLDWTVFHVEHQYADVHGKFNKVLKHRNALLKSGTDTNEFAIWSKAFVDAALGVDQFRRKVWNVLQPIVLKTFSELLPGTAVSLEYFPGWSGELLEALNESKEKDIEAGLTRFGPHRADIKIRIGRVGASEVLSRGQSKLLVQSLLMGQIEVFSALSGRSGVLLLDDIGGELDSEKFTRLLKQVLAVKAWQVVVTATDFGPKSLLKEYNSAMFHVEHGRFSPRSPEDLS